MSARNARGLSLRGLAEALDRFETVLIPGVSGPRAFGAPAEAAELDAEHDNLARGLDSLCAMMGYLAESNTHREGWGRLREVLFPAGLNIVNQSYTAEAGNAVLVSKRLEGLDAEDKQLLKEVSLGKKTAQSVVTTWLKAAARLGELDRQRQGLQGAGATPAEIHAARLEWIRVTNALLALTEMSGRASDLAPHVGTPLDEAGRRASRRSRASDDKEDPSDPKPDPGPSDPTPS